MKKEKPKIELSPEELKEKARILRKRKREERKKKAEVLADIRDEKIRKAYLENCDKHLQIGDACKYLGISILTIRVWDKKGLITGYRDKLKRRYFKIWELDWMRNKIHYLKNWRTPERYENLPGSVFDYD